MVVAATNNKHKLSEIRPLIEPDFRILSLEDIGCHEDLPETTDTLEGNSLQKASYVFDNYHIPCFADDTGLEVDALNGAPGVYSARYAGDQRNSDDNIDLLLKNLQAKSNRHARFRTVITLISIHGTRTFEGIVQGTILQERHGVGGFGYDPVFQPDGFSRSMAEITLEEKNEISHRGRAIKKLVAFLKNSNLNLQKNR
jgi:non-canonical purine NTP pyrophosphatase, rdgB/HAM1 family